MIRRLSIRGFRTLQNVDVDLGTACVFVGRSGTGKSSLLAALRILQGMAANRWDDVAAELRSDGGTIHTTQPVVSFAVHFDSTTGPLVYLADLFRNDTNTYVLQHETLSRNNVVLFESAGPAAMAANNVSELRELRDMLADGLRVYDIRAYAVLHNREAPWDNEIAPSGANLAAALRTIAASPSGHDAMLSIVAALREVVPTVAAIELADTAAGPRVVVTHDNDVRSFVRPLEFENEGLIRFLAILTTLHQAPGPRILAFEEPEKGIHPGSLCVLADTLRAWLDAAPGRQLIVTTHSPELLNHFGPEELRVVEMLHGRTRIGSLAREQRASVEEQLYRMSDLLTTDLARIDENDDGGD